MVDADIVVGRCAAGRARFSKKVCFFTNRPWSRSAAHMQSCPTLRNKRYFIYGWLKRGQMMDGLGLAETTARPLKSWCCNSSLMGAWQHPEGYRPWLRPHWRAH